MRYVAIGDPQAPYDTFLSILRGHALLDSGDRLRDDVRLVSMGDHFDYGPPERREAAATDGEAILSWLAEHSSEQVTILVGNHDLARVCELAAYDDEAFLAAYAEARVLYDQGADESAFRARHPQVPDAECVARDYSCFRASQRELVTRLLRTGRLRMAAHHAGLLLVHAGVTVDDLAAVGLEAASAAAVADGLNAFLDARVAAWTGGTLDLAPLHRAGSSAHGEGRGVLYQRPCDPASEQPGRLDGPPRRRFDPRSLPAAFPQAIGHIRDGKCRQLMPAWCPPGPAVDGALRSLVVTGQDVRYQLGCAPDARLLFTDAGMWHVPSERYELLDLAARQPLARP
ncbi:MAG: metallophosphoesterase [Myxococcales bacterium]|nr:metallophosphoesterase [Myxococcales bacterium]